MLGGVDNPRDTEVDIDRSLGIASQPTKIIGTQANESVCF